MRILYTAFNGKNNSSKVLLDYVDSNNKLYLTNSFKTSVCELYKILESTPYDLIISFGQAPLDNDTIKIETRAKGLRVYETTYDYSEFEKKIRKYYNVLISNDAGNYLCNNIYYYGLKFIKEHNLKTKMIFIHIPKLKNVSNMEELSKKFRSEWFYE